MDYLCWTLHRLRIVAESDILFAAFGWTYTYMLLTLVIICYGSRNVLTIVAQYSKD